MAWTSRNKNIYFAGFDPGALISCRHTLSSSPATGFIYTSPHTSRVTFPHLVAALSLRRGSTLPGVCCFPCIWR